MDILSKIAYISFIVSIFALYLITIFYEPRTYSIKDTNQLELESFVTINANVDNINIHEKNVFFKLSEIIEIDGMSNFDSNKNYTEMIGKKVKISGKITEYNGKREIIVYSIK